MADGLSALGHPYRRKGGLFALRHWRPATPGIRTPVRWPEFSRRIAGHAMVERQTGLGVTLPWDRGTNNLAKGGICVGDIVVGGTGGFRAFASGRAETDGMV
jgi:hypothetical protein